jgi:two-component sensor histidine kinase
MMKRVIFWGCLMGVLPGFGQALRLTEAWSHTRGDISADSLQRVQRTGGFNLAYNAVLNLQFSTSTKTCYYRILPTEQYGSWIELGPDCTLQIPPLTGGEYSLELSHQNTASASASLKITLWVEQPFWRRWWFWVAIMLYLGLLVSIGVYFFSLYNLRQKLKLHDIRNRIAADLHDEVGSNLNSIAIFAELLRQKAPTELRPILDRITNNSVESVQLMQDTVWALQVHNDAPQRLFEKMRSFASEVLTAKSIELIFDNQLETQSIHKLTLSMVQRKNAYLVFKEAINNVAKHAQASRMCCRIWLDGGLLHIEVHDDGVGFDTQQVFEGNGIRNYALRSQDESLLVNLHSSPQQGTKVRISLPLA